MIPRRQIPIRPKDLLGLLPMGPGDEATSLETLEHELAACCQAPHAVAFGTGRSALLAILAAANIQGPQDPRAQVVLPAYTLGDLATLLAGRGYEVVFADVDKATFLMDPPGLAKALAAHPLAKAVVPTHLFGLPADGAALAQVAGQRLLIEDRAHDLGSLRPAGAQPPTRHAGFSSLETIKLVHAYGGGFAYTNDPHLAQGLRACVPAQSSRSGLLLSKFLRNATENLLFRTKVLSLLSMLLDSKASARLTTELYHRLRQAGLPADRGLSGAQARIALASLTSLPARIEKRKRAAALLRCALSDRLKFQAEPQGYVSNGYFLVGLFPGDSPRALRRRLRRQGIDIGIGAEITDFAPGEQRREEFPKAYTIFSQAVQLPLHDELSPRDLERIVKAVRAET